MSSLEQKIAEGEHQQLDFKFQITDSRKIARTLSAFANTDGGRLLIGVKDNGTIAGIRSNEEVFMIEAAADMYSDPPIRVEYYNHEIDGKDVLEALVQPSANKPHFVKEKEGKPVAYFRQNDENFPASGVLIKFWQFKSQETKTVALLDREKKLLQFLQENPFITVKRFALMARTSFTEAEDLLATFIHWGVIGWRFNGKFFEYFLQIDQEN